MKKHLDYSLGRSFTLKELQDQIDRTNQLSFGGQKAIIFTDQCEISIDYSGCFYEHDEPGITIRIYYEAPDKPTQVKKSKKKSTK